MTSLSFCLLTTFYPPQSFGGDAVQVRRLATGLAESGHRVRVLTNPTAYSMLAGTERTAADDTEDTGIEVVRIPLGTARTTATYLSGRSIGSRRRLERLTASFDVVHVHNPSLLGGADALRLGSGVRLCTTHEHWLLCPMHVLFRYGRQVCDRRTCWRCTLAHRRPPQLWRSTTLLDRRLEQVHAVLAPSRFTADLHRAMFPAAHIEVLPLPGPGPAELQSGAGCHGGERAYFLFAGRLERIKGAEELATAFQRVHGADLVIAGDGSQRTRIQSIAATNPSIRLLGQIPHRQVLELARSARAVVVPSVGYETFGGVAVEAMAVGTPVVVRDLGALPELVRVGGGMTFTDEEHLVRCLQHLVDDAAAAEDLGREASYVAADLFGTARYFRRYFEIISQRASAAGLGDLATRAASCITGSQ